MVDLSPYEGCVATEYRDPALLARLRGIAALVGPSPEPLPFRRTRVVRLDLPANGATVAVAAKAFPPQGVARSLLARAFGSRARRAWEISSALHARGVGTPRPVAYLERWTGTRLVESYFLAEFEAEASSLNRELLHLLHHEPELEKILGLLDPVAAAVRAMHDAGVQHGDLGNQNILLRRSGPEAWGEVRFIDVNRGRVRPSLSPRHRAFDLSRLTLPSKLRRIFFNMYWRDLFAAGARPPPAFLRWERWHRRLFALHTWTRPLRHPFRWSRQRRLRAGRSRYPAPRDLWVWDRRSAQPIGLLERGERYLLHSPSGLLRTAVSAAAGYLPAMRAYRRLLGECYRSPVDLAGRIGMTISPTPGTAERETAFLEGLGTIPVLARYYCHETPREWEFTTAHLRALHARGHEIAVALVQDRRAVRDPARWREFVAAVLEGVGGFAASVEAGHAINRVKWGVWSLAEYERLLRPLGEILPRHPGLRLMGPAINDFEYHYVGAAIGCLPRGLSLGALSLHLYVDRRGAPENRQGSFSAVDKFVLARALARRSRRCEDRVVVSEVNWFLRDPGGYAHPFAPYAPSRPKAHEWDIDEDRYADYMLRYYLHAICSGMVDRVYWWRLAARPFGLVDDAPEGWRARPAYAALRAFLGLFGRSTYLGRLPSEAGVYLLRFRLPAGDEAVIGFSASGDRQVALPFPFERALEATGEPLARPDLLTGRPAYYLHAGAGSSNR